jgi:hydrogenase maturation protease
MLPSAMKTLILGLGNDLLADDAVGILAARSLAVTLHDRPDIDIVETAMHGVALLEFFIGYDRAIILDAIKTGEHPVGTIIELAPSDLRPVISPSPHYTGIPELFRIADELSLSFPREIVILAMEVADPYTIGGEISPTVSAAIPNLIARAASLASSD